MDFENYEYDLTRMLQESMLSWIRHSFWDWQVINHSKFMLYFCTLLL